MAAYPAPDALPLTITTYTQRRPLLKTLAARHPNTHPAAPRHAVDPEIPRSGMASIIEVAGFRARFSLVVDCCQHEGGVKGGWMGLDRSEPVWYSPSVGVRAAAVYRNPLDPAVGRGGRGGRGGVTCSSLLLCCVFGCQGIGRGGDLDYTTWHRLDAKWFRWWRWRRVWHVGRNEYEGIYISQIDRSQSRRRGLPCSHPSTPKGTVHAGDAQIP
jgi:hypothetical protein